MIIVIGEPGWKIYKPRPLQEQKIEKCLVLSILRSLRNPAFAMFWGSGIESGT